MAILVLSVTIIILGLALILLLLVCIPKIKEKQHEVSHRQGWIAGADWVFDMSHNEREVRNSQRLNQKWHSR